MKQYQIIDNNLCLKIVNLPTPGKDEGLIKVKYAGMNRADILQLDGLYSSPDGSNIPGLEISGVEVKSGREVSALLTSGGFSEYIAVNKNHIFPLPSNLELKDAAALPEALVTCYLNLIVLGNLKKGQTVLIHGGSNGIGSIAVQLANALGAITYTTVGSDEKKDFCKDLKAMEVFKFDEDFDTTLKKVGGVDLILDILGGKYLSKNINCLKKSGKLISIAVMNNAIAEINLAQVLMKNLTIVGSTLRSKSNNEKAILIKGVLKNIYPLIEAGTVKPIIDSVFDFNDLPLAIERMRARKHLGKIVINFNYS